MLKITTIENDFRGLDIVRVSMKTAMSRIVYKHHKIFKPIIIFDFIVMMYRFFMNKVIAKIFLYNKTTSFYIPIRMVGERMFGNKNHNITLKTYIFSTFPIRVVFAFRSFASFFKNSWRKIIFCERCFVRFANSFSSIVPSFMTFFKFSRGRKMNTFFVFSPRYMAFREMCSTSIKTFSFHKHVKTFFRTTLRCSFSIIMNVKNFFANKTFFFNHKFVASFATIILYLSIACQPLFAADIVDWNRGTGVDVVEGAENISDIDDMITNYLQDPLDRLLSNKVRGCTITVTDDEVLTISAGEVVTSTAGGIHRMRQNTSTETVDNTEDDVGGIDDDAAAAANTWYYVYAVADADATTFKVILSTSASAPTNDAALHYALIGCALTDATSDWIKAYNIGDGDNPVVMYDDVSNTKALNNGAPAVNTWTDLDLSSYVPSIATKVLLCTDIVAGYSAGEFQFRANGSSASNGTMIQSFGQTTSNSMRSASQFWIVTDSSQVIEYEVTIQSGTSNKIDIWVSGYEINR